MSWDAPRRRSAALAATAAGGSWHDVFLSYASADRDGARQVARAFEQTHAGDARRCQAASRIPPPAGRRPVALERRRLRPRLRRPHAGVHRARDRRQRGGFAASRRRGGAGASSTDANAHRTAPVAPSGALAEWSGRAGCRGGHQRSVVASACAGRHGGGIGAAAGWTPVSRPSSRAGRPHPPPTPKRGPCGRMPRLATCCSPGCECSMTSRR